MTPPRPPRPIAGASAWRGEDMARRDDWIYRFTVADLDAIDAAIASVRRRGLALEDVRRADFPLGALGRVLDDVRLELLVGRGFVLLRGLPVERYGLADAALAYWASARTSGSP